MAKNLLIALVLCASVSAVHATSAPFGVASAYNLVALGYGSTPGDISDNADITGRIAAANDITESTTIGSTLGGDPWGLLANNYAIIAGGGITASNYFNINGGGNVYAPTNTASYNWNETPHGTLVTTGPSPIDFTSLAHTLDSESLELAAFVAPASETGILCTFSSASCAPGAPGAHNPSFLVLYGTSSTLNVFNLTAAQFASTNNPLDIVVPAGSTVIINVDGTNVTLGAGIYFNGNQESDTNDDNNMILFNFADASSVTIDGQINGAVLAPFAYLSGSSQMGGNFIAAEIGQTGEVHNDEFDGTIPLPPTPLTATPEPSSFVLMAGALLVSAVFVRRRILASNFQS